MRRVAGVFPRKVQPATWVAATGVAGFWTAAALYVADHISSQSSAPPKVQSLAVEPVQTPNRAAKAAREPVRKEASLAPDLAPPIIKAAWPVPEIVTPGPEDSAEEDAETGPASWYDLDSKTAAASLWTQRRSPRHIPRFCSGLRSEWPISITAAMWWCASTIAARS